MEGRKTPFTAGNQWRFESGNDAAKRPTRKKLAKQVEELLSSTEDDVRKIECDATRPIFLRRIAKALLSGSIAEVMDAINKI